MRSLPLIALVLACCGTTAAARSFLDPDERQCARVLPRVVSDDRSLQQESRIADPATPLLYKAVDHRLAGCSVLVMHQTGQLRHVPKIGEQNRLFVPAR